MITTIDIKTCAAKPNMPLPPFFAFKDSPSSVRILDVPRKVGKWEITNVSFNVNYPDNTNKTKNAERNGSVWVATVDGCSIAGNVQQGYVISADGYDEDGNAVEGYVLGVGDLFIMDMAFTPSADDEKFNVRYCPTVPENPQKGDLVVVNGKLKFYDGTQWVVSDGVASVNDITPDSNGNITLGASDVGAMPSQIDSDTTLQIASGAKLLVRHGNKDVLDIYNKNIQVYRDINIEGEEQLRLPPYLDIADSFNQIRGRDKAGNEARLAQWIESNYVRKDYGSARASVIAHLLTLDHPTLDYSIELMPGNNYGNKPCIAFVGNGTTKLQAPSSNDGIQTFTFPTLPNNTNATLAVTTDIPTSTSQLTNDSGFITSSSVPTNVSDLTNDAGYTTQTYVDGQIGQVLTEDF